MTDAQTTVTSTDVLPADGGEVYTTAHPQDGQVALEVLDNDGADARVFLTAGEARRLAVQLLLSAESLEG